MNYTPITDPDDEDGDEEAPLNVGDPVACKTRRMSRQCDTCIFRPGDLMHLGAGRLKDIVSEAIAADGYIVCHETVPTVAPVGVAPAICRGFHDRYTTSTLQVMARLWGFVDVDPPDKRSGD